MSFFNFIFVDLGLHNFASLHTWEHGYADGMIITWSLLWLSVELWDQGHDVVRANFLCVMKAHSLVSVEQDSIWGTAARVGCVRTYCSMKPFSITMAYWVTSLSFSYGSDNRYKCVTSLSYGETLAQTVLHIDSAYNVGRLHRAVFIHHITV